MNSLWLRIVAVSIVSALPIFGYAAILVQRLDASPGMGTIGRTVLPLHLLQLGLLLSVGLLVGAVVAHIAVVAPLRHLRRAVDKWQQGRSFGWPAGHVQGPLEVVALHESFARATAELDTRQAQLQAATAQQELAMQEIHHRVKNNLQIVASLLNLQAGRIRAPEAKAEFQSARDRVRALATLHRHLYAHGQVHTINMRNFLTELCGQLFQAFGEVPGQRIRLEIDASELDMSSDQAVPLALVVTEAVSNSVKYAFPDRREGHVTVRLTSEGDVAELMVQDDGVGIPPAGADTESGLRDGLGLQLIRGFSRQLGATLRIDEGHGTRYTVTLPLKRERLPSPSLGAAA